MSMMSPQPDATQFEKYERQVHNLLRDFAKVYDTKDREVGGHTSDEARRISQLITRLVQVNWRPMFASIQYPHITRKGFPRYDPKDPHGN